MYISVHLYTISEVKKYRQKYNSVYAVDKPVELIFFKQNFSKEWITVEIRGLAYCHFRLIAIVLGCFFEQWDGEIT